MAAMVRPVGIEHFELSPGGITPFLLEPAAGELEVGQRHGKSACFQQVGQVIVAHRDESLDGFDVGRWFELVCQSLWQVQTGFPALDRVDQPALDRFDVCFAQGAGQGVDMGGFDQRAFAASHQLDALGC